MGKINNVPFVRSPYNYDREAASDESGLKCEDESLAKQSFAEECDINTIVKRFGLTGELPSSFVAPTYGDFTEVYDYQTALNAVIAARDAFMEMPAELRARFGNDPQQLVEFVSNSDNRAEAERLGLVVPKAVQAAPEPAAAAPGGVAAPLAQ